MNHTTVYLQVLVLQILQTIKLIECYTYVGVCALLVNFSEMARPTVVDQWLWQYAAGLNVAGSFPATVASSDSGEVQRYSCTLECRLKNPRGSKINPEPSTTMSLITQCTVSERENFQFNI